MLKRLMILAIVLCTSQPLFAQEEEKTVTNFNELKINGLYLIMGAFDITYERTLNEESGIGISLMKSFDNDINVNYYVSPYYRFYFGKKYAAGFFIEGFGMLNSYEKTNFFIDTNEEENITDFALGIGLGGKWVTKSGFVGELNLGFGRNLFNTDDDDFNIEEIVGKVGITLGYRF